MNADAMKEQVAEAALAYVPERGVIGLGSGSTARLFLFKLAAHIQHDHDIVGVPSSRESAELAERLGIPLLHEDGPWNIDITFDGADEVDPDLNVIKGGGGALTREKIVIAASKQTVLMIDESKMSHRLGAKWRVPVEVVAFGHASIAHALREFGEPALRMHGDAPFRTDQGGFIYDVKTGPILDPSTMEAAMNSVPGVVTCGIFTGRASRILIAGENGMREIANEEERETLHRI